MSRNSRNRNYLSAKLVSGTFIFLQLSSFVASSISIPLFKKASPDLHIRSSSSSLHARHASIPQSETDYVQSIISNHHARYSHIPLLASDHQRRDSLSSSSTYASTSSAEAPAYKADIDLLNYISDTSYLAAISLGTPPQNFWVTMDTGSSDFFVASPSCTGSLCPIYQFNTTHSSTFQNTSASFKYVYGSGNVSGYMAKESLTLGGFTIINSTIGLVTSLAGNLVGNPASGLMGLGWQDLSVTKATPFWQTLAVKGSISMFSFYLTHIEHSISGLAAGGMMTLGQKPDPNLYTGDINWIDVKAENYWGISLDGIMLNGESISTSDKTSSPLAIIDTGSTLISAPTSVCTDIYSKIGGTLVTDGSYNGYYIYNCSQFQNFTLKFGGIHYEISESNFVFATVNKTTCVGAVIAVDSSTSPGSFTIGDSFLKGVLSIFRYSPASVGFATLSNSAQKSATVSDPVPTFSSLKALQTAESKDLKSDSFKLVMTSRVWLFAASIIVC